MQGFYWHAKDTSQQQTPLLLIIIFFLGILNQGLI